MKLIGQAIFTTKEMFVNSDDYLCLARILLFIGAMLMLYKFSISPLPDYIGFASGISAIGAAFALKDFSEQKVAQKKIEVNQDA